MMDAIRVLQAADWNLHAPLAPIGQLPAHFREIFNQGRERAALRVFDLALRQRVDLLLLTGTLADFQAEPRLACFLSEQFRRLNLQGVSIVWAARRPDQLPAWALPTEHILCLPPGQSGVAFAAGDSRGILVRHLDTAGVVHRSRIEDSTAARDLIITVPHAAAGQVLEYRCPASGHVWRQQIVPLQPAGPHETGPSGVTLLEFSEGHPLRAALHSVATVHWATEIVDLAEYRSRESLLKDLAHRARQIPFETSCELICVQWMLTGTSPLWEEFVRDLPPQRLLHMLRGSAIQAAHVWNWKVHFRPSLEQQQLWSDNPALAEALRQLDQLSTADLAASACLPDSLSLNSRTPALTLSELAGPRWRLVRELCDSPQQPGAGSPIGG